MATYTVTHLQRVNNFAVLTTLEDSFFDLGATITVAGVDPTFNGTFVVYAIPQYLITGLNVFGDFIYDIDYPVANQIVYANTGDNEARQLAAGTITEVVTASTWIESADVSTWLGFEPGNANDYAFLEQCVLAACEFAARRRHEAGYVDSPNVCPNDGVKLGTIMYAAMLYRERGAVDGFASFDGMNAGTPTLSLGRVLQLLGCNRSQVA